MCCNVLKIIMCVCPWYLQLTVKCKVQVWTSSILLRHLASESLWPAKDIQKIRSKVLKSIRMLPFSQLYWKFHRQFCVIYILHINYTARPSQQNHLFQQRNDWLTILLMSAQVPQPWKLPSPVAHSCAVSDLRAPLKAVTHVVTYQWNL